MRWVMMDGRPGDNQRSRRRPADEDPPTRMPAAPPRGVATAETTGSALSFHNSRRRAEKSLKKTAPHLD